MQVYHWVMLGVGVLVGAAAAIFYWKHSQKSRSSVSIPTVDELIEQQKVCHEMTLAIAVSWVQEQQEQFNGLELLYIVGNVNEDTVKMFTMDRSVMTRLDAGKYMFLLAVEREKKTPVAVQLVNFESLEDALEEMLEEDGYCVIEDR